MTDLSPMMARHGKGSAAATDSSKISILPSLFMISLLIPVLIPVGPLLLMPHRIFLILVFFPLMIKLLSGQVGRLVWADYALLFSASWSTVSLFISTGTGVAAGADPIQAAGIYWVEFWGAYLVGRVCIRSVFGFVRFVRTYFILIMILLPFALVESIIDKPVFLSMFPNHLDVVHMDKRWGLRRAQAAFAHPILFGVFASSSFGLFLYVLRPAFTRITGVLGSVITTTLSLSTGAYISVIVQSILIFWEVITSRIYWRWRLFAALCIGFYFLIDMMTNRTPFHVLVTYASFNTQSAYTRILIWEWGIENIAKRPWFGLGLDIVNWDRAAWKSASADNFWLLNAMQYGLPAVASFISAVVMIIRNASRVTLTDKVARRCQAGFLTAMGGIIIAGGTVHYWHQMLAFAMFFFGAGVWLYTTDIESEADAQTAPDMAKSNKPVYSRFPPGEKRSG